jgi:hypothetical protein
MDRYVEFKRLVKEFEDLQHKLRDFGAADTEPNVVFQLVLVRSFCGVDFSPTTADDWCLYTGSPGVDCAAAELSVAAGQIRNFIMETDVRDSIEIKNYIDDYCWRICW